MDAILSLLLVSALQPTAEDQAIIERLERTIFPYSGVMTLGEMLDRIRDVAQVSFYIDPEIDPEGPSLTVEVRNRSIHQVLHIYLGTLDPALAFEVRGGLLYIIPADALMTRTTLVAYSVRDLSYAPPDFPGTDPVLDGGFTPTPPDLYYGFAADDLIDLIQQTIEPDAWDQYNWSLTAERDILLATTVPRIHDRIRAFLDDLRAVAAVQIRIEGRLIELRTADALSWRWRPDAERPEVLDEAGEAWLEEALGTDRARLVSVLAVTAMNNQRNHAAESLIDPPGPARDGALGGNVLDVRPAVESGGSSVAVEVRASFSRLQPREESGADVERLTDVYRHRSTLVVPVDRSVVASLVAQGDRTLALVLRAGVERNEPREAAPRAADADAALLDDAPEAPTGHGLRWPTTTTARECIELALEGEPLREWLRSRPGPILSVDEVRSWLGRGRIESWSQLAAMDGQEANVMSVGARVAPVPAEPEGETAAEPFYIMGGVVSSGRLIRGPAEWIFEVRHDAAPSDDSEPSSDRPVAFRQTRASAQLRPGAYRVVAEHGSGSEVIVTLVRVR